MIDISSKAGKIDDMDIKKLFTNPSKSKATAKGSQKPDKDEPKPFRENGSGDGGNDPRPISRGDCFAHRETKKIYQILGFEEIKIKNPDTDELMSVPLVVYAGTLGKLNKLNVFDFLQRFEKTFTPPYVAKVMKELEERRARSGSLGEVDGETPTLGNLYIPTGRHTFDNMIIFPDAKQEILIGINSIQKQEEMEKIWGLSKILDEGKRSILNFYGPSGTGKTMAARCLANQVKQPLFQVDYAQIVDKYVGETAKKISAAFTTAREHKAILFFDEADSLLSKRVDMNVNSDYANSVNQNRNVLMQELDKFDGIIVMSTNFFNNYDDAMLRRINRHVEFKLPDPGMREKLFSLHIPNLEKSKGISFTKLGKASIGMSGGDIKNVCVNAIEAVSCREDNPEKWTLTDADLLEQIEKVKKTKAEHKKGGSNNREERASLGFGSVKEPVLVE